MNPTRKGIVFVAGGGKYGSTAAKYLLERSDLRTVVCDEDSSCQASSLVKNKVRLEELEDSLPIDYPVLLIGEAAKALVQLFSHAITPKLIIPCVPLHFAAKTLTTYSISRGLEVQPDFDSLKQSFETAQLNNVEYRLYQDSALAVASKMPFDSTCRSGCTQPRICPVTGRRLSKPMYAIIEETLSRTEADVVKVLRSSLLAPSIGGFSGQELKKTADLCIKKAPCTIALATSCRCHAIANILGLKC